MVPAAIFAQGYYYFTSTGTSAPYDYRSTTGTDVITPGSGDVLSTWQTIPFSFEFYGQAVTGFFVSDNGYITFDPAATTSASGNTALPNPSAPQNAIFAYWDALTVVSGGSGVPDQVFVETVGSTPNRMVVIQWVSVTDAGGAFIYAAVRLHEDGHFDIVHSYGNPGTPTATVGIQDPTGLQGISIGASPAYVYPVLAEDAADDVVYEFYPGTQPAIDVAHQSLDFEGAIQKDACIGGTLINRGTQTVTSVEIRWSVDGGQAYSRTYSGLAMGPNQTFTWNTGSPMGLTGGNTSAIRVWVGRVNNQADGMPSNSDETRDVLAQEGTVATDRRVLVEQFTTAVCQFCPDGKVKVDEIKQATNKAYPVAVHAGFGTDNMTTQDASTLAARFVTGAPTAAVDRVLYDGEPTIGFSRYATGTNNYWLDKVNERLNTPTTMCLSMTTNYNAGTRQLTADLTIESVDHHPTADYRVSLMVVEDSVVGVGSGWDQINAYNGQAGHPWAGAGNPIVGFVHNQVLRAMPTGSWGDNSVIPATPGVTTYNHTVNYTVPGAANDNHLNVIAFVHTYDDADDTKMSVINAAGGGLNETVTNNCATTTTPACPETKTPELANSIEDVELFSDVNVYPNPVSNGKVFVELNLEQALPVTVELYNTLGQRVASSGVMNSSAGNNTYFVDTDALPTGSYHVVVSTKGDVLMSRNIVVAK